MLYTVLDEGCTRHEWEGFFFYSGQHCCWLLGSQGSPQEQECRTQPPLDLWSAAWRRPLVDGSWFLITYAHTRLSIKHWSHDLGFPWLQCTLFPLSPSPSLFPALSVWPVSFSCAASSRVERMSKTPVGWQNSAALCSRLWEGSTWTVYRSG